MSNRPICNFDTPDPWVVAANGLFYLTFTLDNRIEIWSSPTLEDFSNCRKSIIWQPQPGSPWSANIWAPELHYLAGRWYVYTCGAPPEVGNPGHRTTILRCAAGQNDPMVAEAWEFLGPLRGMPDQWAIDATVFSPDRGHSLCCCWSGWPLGDNSDTQQDLFLIKMKSPEEAIPETLVCISQARLRWERPDEGRRGVNEGPTWVDVPGVFRGIVYSAHGSWTSEYRLALLTLVGHNPLEPGSWVKRPVPLLVSHRHCPGPHGPGHASFLPNPYNPQSIYCIYHATAEFGQGWANRKARVLELGAPCFGPQAREICCSSRGHRGGSQGAVADRTRDSCIVQ